MRFCYPFQSSRRSNESPEPPSIEQKGKVFEHFLELPNEGRMMIIDEMQADDRCRFTRCSKVSQKQAKASKNYIYGLEFHSNFEFSMEIIVIHHEYVKLDYLAYSGDICRGYILRFDEKYMRYFSIENEFKELWRKKLKFCGNRVQYVIRQFENILHFYETRIKKLVIHELLSDKLKNCKFRIRNLKNLEKLSIRCNIDIFQFISKVRKPLTLLEWYRKEKQPANMDLANFEQMYQVQGCLCSPHTKLNNEQFQRLSASWVVIDIGYLTEEDIFKFIRSWQNGTIGRRIRNYEWGSMKKSNFDMEKLARLLGVNSINGASYRIEHHTDAGKLARLINSKFNDKLDFFITLDTE